MTDCLLELQNISKSFPQPDGSELLVLRDVSLSLRPGESIALMGANGSGKTTLLRIVLGELAPTQGKVLLMDTDHTTTPAYKRARLIGSVHQESYKSLASELTVEEVLSIAARRNKGLELRFPDSGSISGLIEELSDAAAQFIHSRKKVVTSALSGGQRQMIAIICALMGEPKILLLDEHAASLDGEFTDVSNSLLSGFVKRGGAIVAVTHNEAWSQSNCDYIGWIKNTRLEFYRQDSSAF